MNDDTSPSTIPAPQPGERWVHRPKSTWGPIYRPATVALVSDDDIVYWQYSGTLTRDRLQVMPRRMFLNVFVRPDTLFNPPDAQSSSITSENNWFCVNLAGVREAAFPSFVGAVNYLNAVTIWSDF